MDDEDFNSELLGAAQRQHNLRQNEATRQEIAALRADLKRKEAAEKAAPKCPYCAGAITSGVVKCRHCSSDIKWGEFDSKLYPMKAEEAPNDFANRIRREREASGAAPCSRCGRPVPVGRWKRNSHQCFVCRSPFKRESQGSPIAAGNSEPTAPGGCLLLLLGFLSVIPAFFWLAG